MEPHYYSDKNSEIDFILQFGADIVPVEAKGGETSLHRLSKNMLQITVLSMLFVFPSVDIARTVAL